MNYSVTFCQAHTGKLNKTSVVLEGSGASSGGARINVDLSHLESTTGNSYSIFPGQIVAVEGINLTGRKLVAHRICEGAAQKPQASSVRELRDFHHDRQEGAPLKIVAAAGPFTTSDNLEYQPLIDLVSGFMEDVPDAVILTGPFVDAKQELIRSGRVLAETGEATHVVSSYEAFFANKISALLTELFGANVATQFILIPSLDDTVAKAV
jgi:DNA polymerase alpha subunit B